MLINGGNPISDGWPPFGMRPSLDAGPIVDLSEFYTSDTIAHHYSTDFAYPSIGPIEVIRNRGEAASALDATAVGSIPEPGSLMTLTAEAYLQLGEPIAFSAMRLMWLMTPAGSVSGTRYFGHVGAFNSEIRVNINTAQAANSLFQFWTNDGGSAVTLNLNTARFTMPTSGLHLFEIEVDEADVGRVWVDGVSTGSGGTVAGAGGRAISILGRGAGTTAAFSGLLGDVMAIRTGRPDTVAAIAAARSHFNSRYKLGLPI